MYVSFENLPDRIFKTMRISFFMSIIIIIGGILYLVISLNLIEKENEKGGRKHD